MRCALPVLLFLAACGVAPPAIPQGEEPLRWRAEIEALTAEAPANDRPVVFVGSSSIRRWTTLARDMAPLPVRNRGFGGSKIFDTVYWLDRLVVREDPSVVVVFAGTNDIAGAAPRPGEWVAARFAELVQRLRALGCGAPLVYVAISPSPSRVQHVAIVRDANARIAALCAADPTLTFVDTARLLVDADGRPDARWFVGDGLHLAPEGYARWTAALRPVVERLRAAALAH